MTASIIPGRPLAVPHFAAGRMENLARKAACRTHHSTNTTALPEN